jgi:hypothetical protein
MFLARARSCWAAGSSESLKTKTASALIEVQSIHVRGAECILRIQRLRNSADNSNIAEKSNQMLSQRERSLMLRPFAFLRVFNFASFALSSYTAQSG